MKTLAPMMRWIGLVLVGAVVLPGDVGCAADGSEPPEILFRNGFDDDPVGTYTVDQLRADWLAPTWDNGVSEGRVAIVGAPEADSGHALRVLYPQGSVGPGEGGAQWQLRLGASYDELYCAYRIKFASGYDFVRGGKLPGLAGGAANTGGDKPTGLDGWSARMMWRPEGQMVQYVYHPDQPTIYGEDFVWTIDTPRHFTPGVWQQVEHRIVMNTPGQRNGLIQGWLNGVLALEIRDLRFRDVDTFAIEMLYFSTFFGGADESWAATRDEHVYFDDFVISTRPISHAAPEPPEGIRAE